MISVRLSSSKNFRIKFRLIQSSCNSLRRGNGEILTVKQNKYVHVIRGAYSMLRCSRLRAVRREGSYHIEEVLKWSFTDRRFTDDEMNSAKKVIQNGGTSRNKVIYVNLFEYSKLREAL